MMDAFSGVTEFVRMTAAKVHDKQFLYKLKLPSDSFVVFDKAYNLYAQYAKWTKQSVWFVTRMKENAVYHVTKVITDNSKKKAAKGVLKEQFITIGYKDETGKVIRLKLRRIVFNAEDGKQYVFITNNFKISAKK
ncbi:MAG: transposase [Bacteroidetes bacterium]|nr:transposase [Bacteroidota bacterium]